MRQRHQHGLLAALLGLGVAVALLLTFRATQLTATGTTTSTNVRLPSPQGTGLPTGTLAIRVFSLVSGAARYSQGAPVVVFAPGGTEAGTLAEPLTLAADTVRIAFLFPGGCDGPLCSDGLYDERGMRSIAALRDVILYAAGVLTDAQGHTIDEAVDVSVLHDNVGLFGASNGGNVVVAALHGDKLSSHLRYVIQWESPVSSQAATVELGRGQDHACGSAALRGPRPARRGHHGPDHLHAHRQHPRGRIGPAGGPPGHRPLLGRRVPS